MRIDLLCIRNPISRIVKLNFTKVCAWKTNVDVIETFVYVAIATGLVYFLYYKVKACIYIFESAFYLQSLKFFMCMYPTHLYLSILNRIK